MSSADSEKSKMRAFLDDPLAVGGLGQDDQVALQAPAQQDLRRRAPEALGDLADAPVAEMAAGAQRAVGLQRDATLLAPLEQAPAERERAELDLVDDRWRRDVQQQLVKLGQAEVQDADRARGGREVATTGDGFFAAFAGPARAISCACAMREAVRTLGVELRVGLHTGEVETVGEDLAGIAVHIGARVAAAAQRGEVLVSRTVADLGAAPPGR